MITFRMTEKKSGVYTKYYIYRHSLAFPTTNGFKKSEITLLLR